jgi:ATP/maltotriose-dependent transcriptional regulator MalT
VNLVFAAAALRRHELVERTADEAVALFDEYQTTIPANAIELYRARSRLDRGRWAEARAIAARPASSRATLAPLAHAIEGLVAARRGAPDGLRLLERAWAEIREVPESAQHGTIRVALVEAAWVRGDRAEALGQLRAARETLATTRFARSAGELALWGLRHGLEPEAPPGAPEPVRMELAGEWRGAIGSWQELEAPYAAAGARAPRGPRRSTRAHPAGLTRREQEVLERLAAGATNPAIAAVLHVSERTVAHHVSAILGKLGAATRLAAVEHARARGLLSEDRQSSTQR